MDKPKKLSVRVSLPETMKILLELHARKKGHSLNHEIACRLGLSLETEANISEGLYNNQFQLGA